MKRVKTMNNNEKNGFRLTYSAREEEEVRRIREKYAPKEESKLERLRRLDRSVTRRAEIFSLVFGVLGALILGTGLSLVLSDLSLTLGIGETAGFILGILLGLFGGALASFAYPLYKSITLRERERLAPEILRLTEELLK